MAPGISHSRFTHPIDSERPKGASRFEFLAPKLKRRVTLFDPFHVRLWALLESNPRVLRYCERPAYWHQDNRRQLAVFGSRSDDAKYAGSSHQRPSRPGRGA